MITREIKVIDHCQAEIIRFLKGITVDQLFDPRTWRKLRAFVKIVPNGDILPVRGSFNSASNDWQVSINHVYAGTDEDRLWYSLPDVVVSVLLTGRIPDIVDAFRIEPSKQVLPNLRPTKFRGEIRIDPRRQDFFTLVIEERKRLRFRKDLTKDGREWLDKGLKVLANSTSYGIYGQMDRKESNERKTVKCHGLDPNPYECRVQNPDVPGEFCCPLLASLTTGAARLMLGLLEKCVTDMGGTYAMEDTDSMAIVATQKGGLVPCESGPFKLRDSTSAIKALSWARVRQIVDRFEKLNPYDRAAVPGSILKVESCNFDRKTKRQREIWCFAISAKRYALFVKARSGRPALLCEDVNCEEDHWSEHGLGHLLNPSDIDKDDRDWIAHVWQWIIEGCSANRRPVPFAKLPAIGRLTVSSPSLSNPLASLNVAKAYAQWIKPFNFLVTCHVNPFGHPKDCDPKRFHLIAQYQTDSKMWVRSQWIEQYSGKSYKVTTDLEGRDRRTAWVKTYADVIEEYAHHPEAKCADKDGNPSGQPTIGLLFRRHVRIGEIVAIGKESNSLEEVDAGLLHSADQVYTVYPDRTRDFWAREIASKLKKIPLSVLIRETGLSRRMLVNVRGGQVRPHRRNQTILIELLHRLAAQQC
ncbi:MAG TPA: hypothetical protein VFA99_16990 [Acidobacteriaceae bacterium]|nr:hypothetical protein [Acidobacteriaceae bacterium]